VPSVASLQPPEALGGPLPDRVAARRLVIDLIAAEQARLLREKRLSPRQRIEVALAACPPGEEGEIEIGEEALGFDSLMLLDLVHVVSRYFCMGDSGAEDLLLVHRRLDDWACIIVAHFNRLGSNARIAFETSGTTGMPKRIVHPLRLLAEEADEQFRTVLRAPSGPMRILGAVPPRHIYGFIWTVLLPRIAGAAVVELHRSAEGAMFRLCKPGDVVIGTPFIWERAVAAGARLPPGVTGVTSAGPSTDATWRAAEILGLERFVEVYGSTETGGVGWRETRLDAFSLFGRLERHEDGRSLTRGGTDLAVPDRLTWSDDGRFSLGGRRDAVVQVAGTNVSCDAVAAVLEGMDGVADAAVRLDGDRVVALVVPDRLDSDLEKLEYELRMRVIRELPAAARPVRFGFAKALPRNEMGKLAGW
jgi:4-coumarate--CoA ligase